MCRMIIHTRSDDPFADGWEAFGMFPSPPCPYPAGSEAFELWQDGFDEAIRDSLATWFDEGQR
ncbi:hypothetical protein A6A05_16780 [Magnetospirillum moscoviense]|uniref:Uncharacterized protein n=2 Tax=Magnetospirillum moscoviense TaxID=1437059 RepID=A0A178MAI1_9PROT|nr:hypothetical protein A6A05_16780 [Magnetospirillum moscoviense]